MTISIEEVFLQLAPRGGTDWNAAEKAALATKLEQLEIQELLRQKRGSFGRAAIAEGAAEEAPGDGNGEGKSRSWSQKLAAVIAENILIEIKNVHFRFEVVADPTRSIALGLTVCMVKVATTNEQGEQVDQSEPVRDGSETSSALLGEESRELK